MAPEYVAMEDLDESKVSGENGEMYLFQWLAGLEKTLKEMELPVLKAKQTHLEATLSKVVTAPAPFPSPGRALRNVTSRCLISLYSRGESRSLFDTLGVFLKVVAEYKVSDKDMNKIAAFYCVGELMATFGSQFMSYMAEIAATALRTLKSSHSSLLRFHALIALRKSVTTAKRALTDAVSKDIIKQMRHCLNDKALSVQRAAADVLIVMYSSYEDLTLSDMESLVTTCTKSLEGADHATRRALSRLVGHILALTQEQQAPPPVEPNPKNKKDKNEDDGDILSLPPVADSARKTMLSSAEMFCQISIHFNKPHTSRKTRIGLFDFYSALFTTLGPGFVSSNYSMIVGHLMTEIVVSPKNSVNRYETLLMRSLVGVLLRDLIGVRMLSEQTQITAIQELATSYLKRWPALMPGQVAPSPLVLIIILKEVAELLQQLGNTPPPVQEALSDPLVTLLGHSNHSVRVGASWALRCFCYSTPLRLPRTIITVMEMLQRDLSSLLLPTPPIDIHARTIGHAYGLAALVSVIPERPLYVSYDVTARVLNMAINLLKRASEHDLNVADVEVEVAWMSIAALMSLGPNFVRPHLPQLLVLWRNALPKPTSKDSSSGRSLAEWMFLLHVRESALGAILCFLRHNSTPLVTLDVARRIASLLTNALSFVNSFVSASAAEPSEPLAQMELEGLSSKSREALLRRRIYQCFTALGFSSISEVTQSTLLQAAVSLFASPDDYAPSVQAAIASSSGSFNSVWQCADGYGYGVTYIDPIHRSKSSTSAKTMQSDSVETIIDTFLSQPVIGTREHDPLSLCQPVLEGASAVSPPSATAVVDAAIDLFAELLPLQDISTMTRVLSLVVDSVNSSKHEKSAGRKAAVLVNVTVALDLFLQNASVHAVRGSREVFAHGQVTSVLSSFLKDSLIDGDHVRRSVGSESMGRLASLAGTSFLTSQIKSLVDQVVNNRDPQGRAGCALAFGAIYDHVGGLAAGPLLKTTVNILMSLSNDSHPIVHFWALRALARVINAASLTYAPFVSSTLGMLLKIYLLESHEPEGGSQTNANVAGDHCIYPIVCKIIDAIITVLGPDIQESARTRTLVLNLVHEFSVEDDGAIAVEAIKCIQHFLMFAPEHVQIPELIDRFRTYLASSQRPLKLASINALYQLVQRDALAMSKLGGDRLVEDLFGMLDDDSSVEGVRNVISSWLHQTVIYNPSAWIDLCQRIMSRTTASQQVAEASTKNVGLRDDEGEALSVGMNVSADAGAGATELTSRWRTQLFALQCLHEICMVVARSGRLEHFSIPIAQKRGIPTNSLLVTRVPDLIKMAFTASTAYVTEIRLEGLVLLKDVIQIFSSTPDPAYEDSLLLEQYQAPITAALTPAFSGDSTPEILSSAIQACAIFVGCGVVKDISRMGRILKLLTTALEQSKDSGMVSLGDSTNLGPNASAMLRISTLSAWAQLHIDSVQQSYLTAVIDPHRATLATLWIAALRDYAVIRADTEVSNDAAAAPIASDSSYLSLGRGVLLVYYMDAWPVILQSVATAMQRQDPHILAAMHGMPSTHSNGTLDSLSTSTEPAPLFYVIFGLVYEALSSTSNATASDARSVDQHIQAALLALQSLVRPEYAGSAFADPIIFNEVISLCYRVAMAEQAKVQPCLIEAVTILAAEERARSINDEDAFLSSSARAHCLRICAYIIRRSRTPPITPGDFIDRVKMVNVSFEAFVKTALAAQPMQAEDVRGIAILLYSELLADETPDMDFAEPSLPSLKSLLSFPVRHPDAQERYDRLVHGLVSACLNNIDAVRGRQGVVSSRKVKNNLLAAVLILTVVPNTTKISQGVIEHCCFLISEKLLEASDISMPALHCAKTLILAGTAGNPVFHHCTRLLLPGLIDYVTEMVPILTQGSIEEQQQTLSAAGEIWKAFSAFLYILPEEHRVRGLAIILPTMALPLRIPASGNSPTVASLHSQIVTTLMSYASSSPISFREATTKLDASTRDILEQSIRHHVKGASAPGPGVQQSLKPQISLRSF